MTRPQMNLAMPWADPDDRLYSSPTSFLVKFKLGEAPGHAPAALDVFQCCHDPAHHLDGGPIDRVVSRYAGGVRAARLHAAARNLDRVGCRHEGYDDVEEITGIARTYLLRVPGGAPIAHICDCLRQLPTVESAMPNYIALTPFDAAPGLERPTRTDDETAWAPRHMVGLTEALALERGDPGILVGLIDSGVAPGHRELAGSFRAGGYDTVKLQPGDVAPGVRLLGDYSDDDTEPNDDFVGHGMGCAGIIAAQGLEMPPGLAGACRILPMRALGAAKVPQKINPIGLGAIADLDLAATLAVNLGAKVLNLSFGTSDALLVPGMPRPHEDTIAYAAARGCVIVAASGNSGQDEIFWPAAFPDVIAIGAVDAQGQPADFSTRGDHVALCAPGARILTTSLSSYQYATGTSFAAPFVAAAAALLVSHAASRARPLSGSEARDILIRSARPFPGGVRHSGCGAGILDAAAALTTLDEMLVHSPGPGGLRHAA